MGDAEAMTDDTVDHSERGLIGLLLVDPTLAVRCGNLKPAHFRSRHRGEVYRVLLETRGADAVLVAHELERREIAPPPGMHGWAHALSSLLDYGWQYIDEDNLPRHAELIREAALERRQASRRGRADAA